MIDAVFTVAIQGAFSLLFAFAGIEKLRDKEMFFINLEQYRLIPDSLIRVCGSVVILMELVAATLLLLPDTYYGVVIGIVLLSLYALAIGMNLVKGRTWIDCGCLGSDGEGLSYWLVSRNIVLLLLLTLTLLPTTRRTFLWLDYCSIIFTIITTAIAYILINTLLAAHMRSQLWWRI